MANKRYIPDRGDVVWLDFDPRIGHEQSGHRPALVLSNRLMAESTNMAIVVPITSKVKNMPYEILIHGNKVNGAILPFQVRVVDIVARKAVFIEKVNPTTVDITTDTIKNLIS